MKLAYGFAIFVLGIGVCACAKATPQKVDTPEVPDHEALIAQWKEQNSLCRGLSGDDPRTQPACDERQRIGRALYRQGWCYGEKGQYGYQMQWHRCRADSKPYGE